MNIPESTYRQLSETLCDKENATLGELLAAVDQLMSKAARYEMMCRRVQSALFFFQQANRQLARNKKLLAAAIHDMTNVVPEELCHACANNLLPANCEAADFDCSQCQDVQCPCRSCLDGRSHFVWRGLCEENERM